MGLQNTCSGTWVELALRVTAVAGELGQLRELGFKVDDDLTEGDVGYDDEVSFSTALFRLQTVAIVGILRFAMACVIATRFHACSLAWRRKAFGAKGDARLRQSALGLLLAHGAAGRVGPLLRKGSPRPLVARYGWILQMLIGAWECNFEPIPPHAH